MKTWHVEAAVQAGVYLTAIAVQHGTLVRPEIILAGALWLLGRVNSRADRQRERFTAAGVDLLMQRHAVECAAGTGRDLRLVSALFGGWGLVVGSWLTIADVAWTVLYPIWRRAYRGAW